MTRSGQDTTTSPHMSHGGQQTPIKWHARPPVRSPVHETNINRTTIERRTKQCLGFSHLPLLRRPRTRAHRVLVVPTSVSGFLDGIFSGTSLNFRVNFGSPPTSKRTKVNCTFFGRLASCARVCSCFLRNYTRAQPAARPSVVDSTDLRFFRGQRPGPARAAERSRATAYTTKKIEPN